MNDSKSKPIFVVVTIILAALIAGGFWYWSQKKVQEPIEPASAVGTAEALSKSVPEIQTNLGEKVPEVNPLDRANPFKYINPLR